ncbi:unnamed protein product [Cuscuta campestris]|uniref:Uncharacterized protein n=1 Tax=Cuscuta campestris TaxID=132261 RepID=A0A484KBE3_9ASTE|nr:unnamed protein product [Cuscuta campestris]
MQGYHNLDLNSSINKFSFHCSCFVPSDWFPTKVTQLTQSRDAPILHIQGVIKCPEIFGLAFRVKHLIEEMGRGQYRTNDMSSSKW